ncbi:MAG: hypothetical protein LBD72_02815 [Puniceicoccales bacterium]|jgi:hypothetical protein|nr:hypothetical protein [Puniceicoccales bacterium]
MPVQVVTLRKTFDRIFVGKNTLDYDVLSAMIGIDDTFNDGAYAIDATFTNRDVAMKNYEFTLNENEEFVGFTLYAKSIGTGGRNVWTQVMSPDMRIQSSSELFLKKIGSGNQEGYVQIYALNQLNLDSFLIDGRYQSYYADVSARSAAVLYSLSCCQKKLAEIQIRDIAAINNEQKEINRVMALLTDIKNNLSQEDVGIDSVIKRKTVEIDPDVLAFFAMRGLLDSLATQCAKLSDGKIIGLRRILLGEDTKGKLGKPNYSDSTSGVDYSSEDVAATGDFTLSLVDSFIAWTYLHALLTHYNEFMIRGRGTIGGQANCDVYDPKYWVRASETPENDRRGMIGVGDHWIYTGDQSVRWFGNNPPAGPDDFEIGAAGAMARSHGGIHFANPKYFTKNYAEQWTLTNEAKAMLTNPDTKFAVVAPFDSSYSTLRKYFCVDFDNPSRADKLAVISVGNYNPGSFWSISTNIDAYDTMLKGAVTTIRDYGGSIKINGEDCAFWEDTLSLYASQLRSVSSQRLTNMQMTLQSANQSANLASNASKSTARTRMETIGNIR